MKILLPALVLTVLIIACDEAGNRTTVAAAPVVTFLASPASDSCSAPYLTTDSAGTVFLSWTEKRNGVAALKFAALKDTGWSIPQVIGSGSNWFVNWADHPVMASDGNGAVMAHFLEKSDTGKFTYDVKIVRSADTGKTWSAPDILHDDGQKAEHGFVSLLPYADGFLAAWLDGRHAASAAAGGHEGHQGQMTLRSAMLDRQGKKTAEWELDDRVCDCCQTAAAMTGNGPVVVYRDRSAEEVRDMSIVRYVNHRWTAPLVIHHDHWKIAGCPVNGPRIDARGNQLAVAWYAMPEKEGLVQVIFSSDGGAHFGEPVRIDEGKAIGRVDVLWLNGHSVLVSWMEGATIQAVKVHANGTKETPFTIAASSEARSSGFPQMTRQGNRVIFAWTDAAAKTIRTATVSL